MSPSNPHSSVEIKGLKDVQNFVNIFRTQRVSIVGEELEKLANWMADEVRKRIRRQLFQHKPLKPAYLEKKRREGLDTRVLMATAEYVNSITVIPRKRKGEVATYAVGVPNREHTTAGIPLKKLARIHEFGAPRANIPARPHWRPVWSIIVRRESGKAIKSIRRRIMRKFKKP